MNNQDSLKMPLFSVETQDLDIEEDPKTFLKVFFLFFCFVCVCFNVYLFLKESVPEHKQGRGGGRGDGTEDLQWLWADRQPMCSSNSRTVRS